MALAPDGKRHLDRELLERLFSYALQFTKKAEESGDVVAPTMIAAYFDGQVVKVGLSTATLEALASALAMPEQAGEGTEGK